MPIKILSFNETEADLNKFDKIGVVLVASIDKKIHQTKCEGSCFNVDPLFNNAIDGLMYIRIADIPESTMKPVMEEFQTELERKLTEKEG
jgi:hypothetical protein